MTLHTHQQGTIQYLQKGEHPSLLLLSGMHGDEHDVIPLVHKYLVSNIQTLPDVLYIPQVSPSAVTLKTRTNNVGHDINRSFTSTPIDTEVVDCMNIFSKHNFSICLDFHEDPDFTHEFYVYDTGFLSEDILNPLRTRVKEAGFTLLNGVDDPSDPTLGYIVDNGYVSMKGDIDTTDTGFASGWMIRHGLSDRVITIEIPGKASVPDKERLIHALFSFFHEYNFMIQ